MKNWLKNNRSFLVFLIAMACFRTAIADWNPVPSGSMRPTILEGDVVFVNRLAYDLKVPLTDVIVARLGEPQRGDIATLTSPRDGERLIKRIVAIPGDVVELRDEVLFINRRVAQYRDLRRVRETLAPGVEVEALRATESIAGSERTVQVLAGVQATRSFGPAVVPEGHYFVLGDNRDNSADSRFIGFIPRERLIGRAERILVSADITGNWMPRLERTIGALR